MEAYLQLNDLDSFKVVAKQWSFLWWNKGKKQKLPTQNLKYYT